MTDLPAHGHKTGVPVIDGVVAGVKMMEASSVLGLQPAVGAHATPRKSKRPGNEHYPRDMVGYGANHRRRNGHEARGLLSNL